VTSKRPPRPAVADLRTSEVLRRAAALLDPLTLEARIIAAELRTRAAWIEGARHDPGVSEERRKAIAALEAGEERGK
jgi:hypothetical protein